MDFIKQPVRPIMPPNNPGEPFNHGPNDIDAGWRRGVTPDITWFSGTG